MEADPEYADKIKLLDPQLAEAYINGSWDIYPGQFFKHWNRLEIDCDPFPIPPEWTILDGLDYAENAPCSYGRYALSPNDELFRVWGYYVSDRSGVEHSREIKSKIASCPFTKGRQASPILADPSMWNRQRADNPAGVSPAQVFRGNGLYLRKAINERENGWRACNYFLHSNKFHAFKGLNEDFMRTVPSVRTDPKNSEDIVKGGEDHPADEFRYVCIHAFKPSFIGTKPIPGRFSGYELMKQTANTTKSRRAINQLLAESDY